MCWRRRQWCRHDSRSRCWNRHCWKGRNVSIFGFWFFYQLVQSFNRIDPVAWKKFLSKISKINLIRNEQGLNNSFYVNNLHINLLQCGNSYLQRILNAGIFNNIYQLTSVFNNPWRRYKSWNLLKIPNFIQKSRIRKIIINKYILKMGLEIMKYL